MLNDLAILYYCILGNICYPTVLSVYLSYASGTNNLIAVAGSPSVLWRNKRGRAPADDLRQRAIELPARKSLAFFLCLGNSRLIAQQLGPRYLAFCRLYIHHELNSRHVKI